MKDQPVQNQHFPLLLGARYNILQGEMMVLNRTGRSPAEEEVLS
jgi:hypothetical protein